MKVALKRFSNSVLMEQVTEKDHQIFLTMVEPPLNFFKVEMEVFFGDTPVMVEPMLCIAPKSFDTVDMIPTFWSTSLFSDHDMVSTDIQEGIGMPVIRVKKTSWSSMSQHQWDQVFAASIGNRKGQNFSISLVDTEYHVFASGSPTTFPGHFPSKEGLIQFDLPGEKRQLQDSRLVDSFPKDMVPSLDSFGVQGNLEAQPICWYAQTKEFQKPPFPVWGNSCGIPTCPVKLPGETTLTAPFLPGGKMPEFRAGAARTFPHGSIIIAPNPLSKN